MKSANTDLVQIKAVAETALADVQPQFMTPELCKWALVKASQGYSALEIRQTALEAQQIAIQKQLAAMSTAIANQNQLMMHMAKSQELQAVELRQMHSQLAAQQQQTIQAIQAHESRIKAVEETPVSVTNFYETVENTVTINGEVRGVVNIEASNRKQQGGAWWFVAVVLIFVITAYGGTLRRIEYVPTEPPKEKKCTPYELDPGVFVCKEDVKPVPTKGEL